MLWVLSFLLFSGSAATVGVLVADRFTAYIGADQPRNRTDGNHGAPGSAAVLDAQAARASALPEGVRPRLWSLAALTFLLGCLVLAFAS